MDNDKVEPKEDHHTYAHRKSVELAMKTADPILQPHQFHSVYWSVMAGFGFYPYIPGVTW